MTLKDLYELIGGDYDDTLKRLINEEMIKKFLFKFPSDQSFERLKKSLYENDVQSAFISAHTLYGVCQSLGLGMLGNPVHNITESLRKEDIETAKVLFPEAEIAYNTTISHILEYNKFAD